MPYYIKEKPILQNSSDVRNLTCFAAQNQQLEAQRKQLTAKNLPRLAYLCKEHTATRGFNMRKMNFRPIT